MSRPAKTKKKNKEKAKRAAPAAPKKARAKSKPKKEVEEVEAPPREEKPKRAPKAKQKVEEERIETPAKTVPRSGETVKLGPPPSAVVVLRRSDSLHKRAARGFSFGELASAGVPLANARRRKDLSIDIRRRSVVEENVEKLKDWFNSSGNGSAKKNENEEGERPTALRAADRKK